MLVKCVAKLFALQPKANAIEAGIITALILTAIVATLLAVQEPLAVFYDTLTGGPTGGPVVGVR